MLYRCWREINISIKFPQKSSVKTRSLSPYLTLPYTSNPLIVRATWRPRRLRHGDDKFLVTLDVHEFWGVQRSLWVQKCVFIDHLQERNAVSNYTSRFLEVGRLVSTLLENLLSMLLHCYVDFQVHGSEWRVLAYWGQDGNLAEGGAQLSDLCVAVSEQVCNLAFLWQKVKMYVSLQCCT